MRFRSLLLLLVVLTWTGHRAFGRGKEYWPYERLFQEADLIVIGQAKSNKQTTTTFRDDVLKFDMVGVHTDFRVIHILKGKIAKNETKLRILHFIPDPGPGKVYRNGPNPVSFRLTGLETATGKGYVAPTPQYLLFLKKNNQGVYEPVSGRIDPKDAVKEIYSPLPKGKFLDDPGP
jgi:hypothetical protein